MAIYTAEHLRSIRVIVTGGGTGGHTYPALTTIRTLRARLAAAGNEPDVLWVGVADGLEARVARREGIPFTAITTGKLRRSPNLHEWGRNLADAFRVPLGIFQAIMIVVRTRPAVVFSTGGYVSVPIGIAAWMTRRPLVMHEQILTLGLANRILARLADRVLLSHESSIDHLPARARTRAVVTGNPVRPEILSGNRDRALAAYHLDPRLPLVYVTGGAQGAVQVNNLIADILPGLLPNSGGAHGTLPTQVRPACSPAPTPPPTASARRSWCCSTTRSDAGSWPTPPVNTAAPTRPQPWPARSSTPPAGAGHDPAV
jgi:UDP-N-acetylglucosamine--N-acetylmuramyl-(pentapeptide) pyrophosphoryl-undecaprenol N-acetylglucosamine transferase